MVPIPPCSRFKRPGGRLATLLIIALLPVSVTVATDYQRPRVAVALAGGGAWGYAHVGVLELIEELGIPVDIVVGTSIGGIVGGLYAAGYTAEQLAIIAETTDWNAVLFDTTDRLQSGYEDRRHRRSFRATLGFRDGEPILPTGASHAQRVVEYLDDLLRVHAVTDSFLEMPRELAVVAADLVTGEEVVYTEGDLKTAIRASMSVPGVFSPVYYDGRYLIDGGWVNNVPVNVARTLGADIVIAVNLNVMDRKPEDLRSIGAILEQSTRIVRQESILRNLEEADLVITPDLRGYLPSDFQHASGLIQRGRVAAETHREPLQELARGIHAQRGATSQRRFAVPEADVPVELSSARFEIAPTLLESTERNNPRALTMLEELVERMRDRTTSVTEIQREVYGLYETGIFDYVSYDLVDRRELVIYAEPREVPRSTLSLGIGFRAQMVENAVGMGLAHVRYSRNPGGTTPRWILDGWLSRTAGTRIGLKIPLTPQVHLTPAIYAVGENMPFYDDRSVESFYVRRRFGGETGVSFYLGRSWDITLKGFGEWLALQRLEGGRVFDFTGTTRYGARLEVWRDTLDRDLFPRGGSETRLAYRVHRDTEQNHWAHLANFATSRYWSPAETLTLGTRARVGTDLVSGVAIYERFFLGGVENWYGYYYQELQARHYGVVGLDGRVRIGTLPLPLGDGIYLAGGTQYGGIHDDAPDTFLREADQKFGGHVSLAFDTALGALHIGAAFNDEGRVMSFIELGPVYTIGGTGYDW